MLQGSSRSLFEQEKKFLNGVTLRLLFVLWNMADTEAGVLELRAGAIFNLVLQIRENDPG